MFFKEVQSGAVPKVAVIGCGCSVATEPVAEISHYWNIPQVSLIHIRQTYHIISDSNDITEVIITVVTASIQSDASEVYCTVFIFYW